ncbi:MAG: acetyl-CoA synthetase [Candidatus Jettenia sp.]|uniref:Acetate-CoA ligase n=2 Tax=Candidatus Jettenia TaxID=360731 RepID=I3II01_9BACT|nr:MAG: acetyl-CoA synthetase [Candidatus Jettenia sp. AMX1]MBC6930457.1 acetyl-CoA synthetase [Candidatus Jettenia sp.]GAB61346.1 acetate-CoA ligase [Candidatus Jettenia caeni]MCE7882079.1 acetyl-CoA synthetase [Candidatus Jettenia sp. AMX1]MCQ3928607.1 acetyl-CoA synthetase [Candidatus Jettenia sp.]
MVLTNDIKTAQGIIQKTQQQKRPMIEPEAKEFINAFGITSTRYRVVSSVADAVQAATFFGYPVVLKIVSPDISHKTDVGGVKIAIRNEEGIRASYEEIMRNVKKKQPNARIYGILIEEMAVPSAEVIIGGLRDFQFGPVVMFGLGGIFVEIFKDVSFRIAPVEEREALDMIYDVKGARVLRGFRGTEPLDILALTQTILQISRIMTSLEEVREIDLNPVLVYQKGIKTVDARIVLDQVYSE